MYRVLFMLFLALVVQYGCQVEKSELEVAEEAYNADPTSENYANLVKLYNTTLEETGDPAKRKEMLERAFEASRTQKSSINTLQYVKKLLIEKPDDPKRQEWLVALGDAYKNLNKKEVSQVFYHGFTDVFPEHDRTDEYRKAIADPGASIDSLIQDMSNRMFNDSLVRLETAIAYNYVDACDVYSFLYPKDPKSAEYLHKSAETLRSLRSIPQSLEVYNRIIEEFPDHHRAVQSLFLKAFTYDNNMQEYDSARKYYELFLEKYPDDEFASSAEFLLENLGKSDEELLNVLQQKNQQNKGSGEPTE